MDNQAKILRMSSSLLLLIGLLIPYVQANINSHKNDSATLKERESKFFSLFSIVRFSNSICTTSSISGGLNGTCYTSNECAEYGGSAYGSCASGFGVCCVVTISSCGSTTSLNNTYWTNPGYSSSYTTAGECTLDVTKCSSDICQMRLYFIAFNIAQPDSSSTLTAGRCLTDIFTVTGQSNVVPAICGINTNQHMYLDMTPGQDTFSLSMTLSGTTNRYWDIWISQIPCGASYAAPDNCLQYFMDTSGTAMSFNYLFSTVPAVQHLAFQDYTVCVRTNSGFCGIEWSACTSTGGEPAFGISAATISYTSFACAYDFLMFQCITDQMNSIYLSTALAFVSGAVCAGKLCGIYFHAAGTVGYNAPGYSYTYPFMFRFHSDGTEQSLTAGESYGYCLSYTQQPCTSAVTGSG